MHRLPSLVLIAVLSFLLEYYVFQAAKIAMANQSDWLRRVVYGIFWGMTIASASGVLLLVFNNQQPADTLRNLVFTVVIINLLAKITAGFFVFADDIWRLAQWAFQGLFKDGNAVNPDGKKITRSEFLSKTALIAGALPVAIMSYGMISGAYDYRVRRKIITLKNLPRTFDGMRIGQLSDIHSGSFYNKAAVKGGVDMLLAEKPDVFFFTGDLVNNQAKELNEYFDIFSKVKAPLGQFSVLGNHDYGDYHQWSSGAEKKRNLDNLIQSHRDMGWDILLNEHRYLEVDGERLAILGVENWGARGFAKYGDLGITAKNVEADAKILLSHDPSHWDAQIRPQFPDIDLTLSGHTHGFQFGVEIGNFRWSPSQYFYKQWADLYTEGDQHLYVNRGFGFIGYPGRVGILPEITILELKRG